MNDCPECGQPLMVDGNCYSKAHAELVHHVSPESVEYILRQEIRTQQKMLADRDRQIEELKKQAGVLEARQKKALLYIDKQIGGTHYDFLMFGLHNIWDGNEDD